MSDNQDQIANLEELRERIRAFARARDWQQYHSPKNLSMALIAEAAEVVEHFMWMDSSESRALDEATRAEVELELADVLVYLVTLADLLGVDLLDAARRKLALNAEKYPVSKSRGNARKYDKL